MKGIIIAGGLGTRLRPLTFHRPKPLVPVVNRPFLEYQVALLKQHGIEDIVFATNYKAEMIEGHFGDGSRFGVRMRYAIEDQPLGTGGAIRNAADVFPGEAVAVFNGDVLTDFNLSAIQSFHRDRKAIATITLSDVARPNPFGKLIMDETGRVQDWIEPTEAQKKALAAGTAPLEEGIDHINAGFYLLEPEFIARIPQGKPSSVERDIYPQLLAEKAAVYGISPGGFWMDVGRPEQLMEATDAILTGKVHVATAGIPIGDGCSVASDATLKGSTVLGANCRIGEGAFVENCVLYAGAQVGKGVRLSGVIIDEGAVIEEGCLIEARDATMTPVIAAGSTIKAGTRV
jgi:NDP-sugar pyrophosphorylase family protein